MTLTQDWSRSKLITLVGVVVAHVLALLALDLAFRKDRSVLERAMTPLTVYFVDEPERPPPEVVPSPPQPAPSRRTPAPPVAAAESPAAPSNAPTALPPVDWYAEAESAVERAVSALPIEPVKPGQAKKKREFGWSHSRIKRIEQVDGATYFWINDRCVLVNFLIPMCKIGRMPPRGDLFDGMEEMHDDVLER